MGERCEACGAQKSAKVLCSDEGTGWTREEGGCLGGPNEEPKYGTNLAVGVMICKGMTIGAVGADGGLSIHSYLFLG